ncbi:hypothetical protein DWU98_15225 [Dyella monticola]|uniref:Uncharacterized protein n=1 Tax=Dyella monticola TaxID=1927958 RepID=A0A370WVU5_9GAMM|nr:hypothetical protein [Dyella monticola]RDS80254.1 hypothetical protein DWU98_15225 [Dyella monticola]
MKLLRDFFRVRTAGRLSLAGRRQAVRPRFTVTVPQPLSPRQPAERGADASRTSRHLQLVSSH